MNTENTCPNCGRSADIVPLTKHHVIPKVRGGKNGTVMVLCNDCHVFLNTQYTPAEQQQILGTQELVLADEAMQKFARFAAKQTSTVAQHDSHHRKRKRGNR